MNILSISQLQTQTARTDFSQVLASDREANLDSEKPSFARALEEARNSKSDEPEKLRERNPEDENRIARNENRPESEGEDKKISDSEKDGKTVKEKEGEKSEKIAKKDSEADETDEKIASSFEFSEDVLARIQNFNASAQNINDIEDNTDSESLNLVLGDENFEIDDKMIAWLMSPAHGEESVDDMSSEDFAAMIDAAVEFIPGFASEEEKLESAQNLAVNDPELFLNTVADAHASLDARGASKSFLSQNEGKTASVKDSSEKKGAKLSVHDLRTHHLFEESDAKIASDKAVQKSAEKKEINLSMQKQADGNMQMTMELASRAQENITSSSSQAAGATGSDFQAMLSNAVQDNAPEFVKAGNIVLKDNNQGTINLILRPEGLGNVKISLNLDDKNLSAQITVQTKEAMDAFRESISSLKQAFAESGFETGSFDLNFSNNQNQQGFAQGENNQNNQNAGIYAQRSYGEFVTPSALAQEAADAYSNTPYGINIVA